MKKMQGLTLKSINKHPYLYPIYLCVGAGGFLAAFYILRLATRSPDVSWVNKREAEPWNYYKDKYYKFYSTNDEIANFKSPAPEY